MSLVFSKLARKVAGLVEEGVGMRPTEFLCGMLTFLMRLDLCP